MLMRVISRVFNKKAGHNLIPRNYQTAGQRTVGYGQLVILGLLRVFLNLSYIQTGAVNIHKYDSDYHPLIMVHSD